MKRALITGANGFIGSHLTRELLSQGIPVRAFIFPHTKMDEDLSKKGSDIEISYGDIRDSSEVTKAVKGCDHIYHLAAYCHLWARKRKIYHEVNVEGTQNICRAAEKNGIQKMVFTSSCETIGGVYRKKMADESDWGLDENSFGPYASSKKLAEQVVHDYIQRGHHAVIVHPTLPLGPGDTAPTPVGHMIQNFLRGKLRYYYATGFNFVDVRDVARGHILAIQRGLSSEHYILGSQNISLESFFEKLKSFTSLPYPRGTVSYPMAYMGAGLMEFFSRMITHKKSLATREGLRASKRPFYFSSAKAKTELGYHPHGIGEALKEEVEYYLNKKV